MTLGDIQTETDSAKRPDVQRTLLLIYSSSGGPTYNWNTQQNQIKGHTALTMIISSRIRSNLFNYINIGLISLGITENYATILSLFVTS